MNKKCSDSAKAVKEVSDFFHDHDEEIDNIFNENTKSFQDAPSNSPEGRFWTSLTQRSKSKMKKILDGAIYNHSNQTETEKMMEREENIKALLKKHFKNSPDRQNSILLGLKLTSLAASDPALNDLIYRTNRRIRHGMDVARLGKAGQGITSDPDTDVPELTSMPIAHLRIIMRMVNEALAFQQKRKVMTPWRHRLFFAHTIPHNVGNKALSMPLNNYLRFVEGYNNEKNAYGNNFMRQKPFQDDDEGIPLDPYTNKPVVGFDTLRRHNAGVSHLLEQVNHFYSVINTGSKQQFSSRNDLFEFFSDYRNGKAIFTKGKDGKFNVYMYGRDRKVPTGKKYENGDLVYEWKGRDYTTEQKQSFAESKKKVPVGNYIEPWKTVNKAGYKGALEFTEEQAREWEMTNRAFDRIFNELYESVIKESDALDTAYKKLANRLTPEQLESLPVEARDVLQRINSLRDSVDSNFFESLKLTQIKRQKLVIGTKSGQERFYDESGDEVVGFPVERYYPDRYFMADLPQIFRETIERLKEEVESLSVVANYNELDEINTDEDDDSGLDRRKAHSQWVRASTDLFNMKKTLKKYLLREEIFDQEDVYDPFTLLFLKQFKPVKHFIPSTFKRKDADVVPNMIASLSKAIMEKKLAFEAVTAIADEKDPIFKRYILNNYLKFIGSPNSEATIAGIPFTDKSFAKTLGVDVSTVIGVSQTVKRYLTGSNLSNSIQGLQQLPSMFTKIAETGLGATYQAINDSQSDRGQKILLQAGIYNFQEMFENAVENVMAGDVERTQKEAAQKAIRRARLAIKKLKKGDKNDSYIKEQIYLYQKELSKIDNSKIKEMSRMIANYAVAGAGAPPPVGSTRMTKFLYGAKKLINPFPITVTERILRGTSFFIGYNKYMEIHPNLDPLDPKAIQAGIDFMNQTDMFLGMEGVGEQFGNEFMKMVNSVTVWRNQKVGTDWRSLKDMYFSYLPTPDEIGGENRALAHGKAFTSLAKMGMLMNARALNMFGGATGGYVVTNKMIYGGMADPHMFVLGGVMAAGGYMGHKLSDVLGTSEKKTMQMALNMKGASGMSQFFVHTGMGLATNFVFYSNAFTGILGAGALASVAGTIKRKSFNSGMTQMLSGLNAPSYLIATHLGLIATKLLSESEEDDPKMKDWIRLLSMRWGLGAAALVNLAFSGTEAGRIGLIKLTQLELYEQFASWLSPSLTTEALVKDAVSIVDKPKKFNLPPKQKIQQSVRQYK